MGVITLGSLFDGSGGFPLAGSLCGIEPIWASEIEPYPIAVTRSRFPKMKHMGSVTNIHGGEIEPVDIITFGSPCQDLSVAGKRAGLKHEANGDEETTRSGLFMEAVRIIREMREVTNGEYPSFAIWENVPGAFSSNKGEDFRTVLEELVRIVEPNASMPPVPKAGWPYADSYRGDGWSLAYRVFDAQYWGVPQRRRRIHLVLDLRGKRAREVLFEREGVRGYFAQSRTTWQGDAADSQRSSAPDDRTGEDRVKCLTPWDCQSKRIFQTDGCYPTLQAMGDGGANNTAVLVSVGRGLVPVTLEPGIASREGGHIYDGVSGTLRANAGDNQMGVDYALKIRCGCEVGDKGALIQTDKSATLATNNDKYLFQHVYPNIANTLTARHDSSPQPDIGSGQNVIVEAAGFKPGQGSKARSIGFEEERVPTLAAEAGGNSVPAVCFKAYDARGNGDGETASTLTGDHENRITDYTSIVCERKPVYCLQGNGIDRADTAGCNGKGWKEDTSYTLNTIDRPAVTFAMQGFGDYKQSEHTSGLKARDYKDATDLVCGVDCRNMNEYTELYPTLQAKSNGGQSLNFSGAVRVRYIVRRLTPTECARLQGFADKWGHIDNKDDFTDEEYRFWLNVRNTHATINGKQVKKYTKAQMLKWYNGLHADSSEYKMWGNGIALPPALYCMQGIAGAVYAQHNQQNIDKT